jgi:hypothetical protein
MNSAVWTMEGKYVMSHILQFAWKDQEKPKHRWHFNLVPHIYKPDTLLLGHPDHYITT